MAGVPPRFTGFSRRSLLSAAKLANSSSGDLAKESSLELPAVRGGGRSSEATVEPGGSSHQANGLEHGRRLNLGGAEAQPASGLWGRLVGHKLRGQQRTDQGVGLEGAIDGTSASRGPGGEKESAPAVKTSWELMEKNSNGASGMKVDGTVVVGPSKAENPPDKPLPEILGAPASVLGRKGVTSYGSFSAKGVFSKVVALLGLENRTGLKGTLSDGGDFLNAKGSLHEVGEEAAQPSGTRPPIVLNNLRHSRPVAEAELLSEQRLIEEARRVLSHEGGLESGAGSAGGKGGQDDLFSADDQWDLMRIQNKLKAEHEYAEMAETARVKEGNRGDWEGKKEGAEVEGEKEEGNGASAEDQEGEKKEKDRVTGETPTEKDGREGSEEGKGAPVEGSNNVEEKTEEEASKEKVTGEEGGMEKREEGQGAGGADRPRTEGRASDRLNEKEVKGPETEETQREIEGTPAEGDATMKLGQPEEKNREQIGEADAAKAGEEEGSGAEGTQGEGGWDANLAAVLSEGASEGADVAGGILETGAGAGGGEKSTV